VLDYSSRMSVILFPGFIDMHVHLRGMDYSYKEDEYTGTLTALLGGVSIVVDMPNTKPELRSPALVEEKLRRLRSLSVTGYGVYAGVPLGGVDPRELLSKPVIGVKVYPKDYYRVETLQAVREAATRGLIVVVHPEDPDTLPSYEYACSRSTRGLWCELAGVRYASRLRDSTGARVHVTHLSSGASVELAKKLKLTCDTAIHYLVMDENHAGADYCVYRVNPPLRGVTDRLSLLKLVAEGLVDAIVTDHAPHTLREKLGDPGTCPAGLTGLEAYARVLATLARSGLISLYDLARLASLGPSRIIGVKPPLARRGYPGYATVIDFSRSGRITITHTRSKTGYTVYNMFEYRGEPVAVIVAGKLAMHEGSIIAKPGYGENIVRWRTR